MQIQHKQLKTAETTEKHSETAKTRATNYHHSVAGSYRTEAATSLCNKLQMSRHLKAMLMRPDGALWDRHPSSVNARAAALSSIAHLRAWRGMEEAESNNHQDQRSSCSHSSSYSPPLPFSTSFSSSNTITRGRLAKNWVQELHSN